MAYGGSYFFGRAWRSLRHGIAHFDIPVSLGILAAYLGSVWSFAQGDGTALYFDSVNVFITLMLLGRFLQERTLLSNRRRLLGSEAFSQARVTVLDPRPRELPWAGLRAGQRLPRLHCSVVMTLGFPGLVCTTAGFMALGRPAAILRGMVVV